MRILMHICCGPCASYPVPDLLQEGHELTAYFFNPNIHPYQEYERRREGMRTLLKHHGVPLLLDAEYEPHIYLRQVVNRENERCGLCYRMRLEKAARAAADGGFEAFTTSLLVSPYQKHEMIKSIGQEYAGKMGVPFFYRDWRPFYRETIKISRELGIYRQPYCGCIYSEWERYARKKGEMV